MRVGFQFNLEYAKYITTETADAFLLIVLQPAMQSNQKIVSEAPISETLLFNLINGVMPYLNRLYPDNLPVEIQTETSTTSFNGFAVGTGCSLGVDSYATIIDLMDEKFPKGMRLTHLALFNSGQHGDNDLKAAEEQFIIDMQSVAGPAKELGLSLVGINSNVNELFKAYRYKLLHRFVLTTCAFPLTLQKLFKTYSFASSHPIDDFSLDPSDICHIEYALVPLICTESVSQSEIFKSL